MGTYEQKLNTFVQGRRFIRLARTLRDRADAVCDACGSGQPRTLFVLKDEESGRYAFVGDTCLGEMTRLGVILKRFGKESAPEAYEREMAQRAEEARATFKEGSQPEEGERSASPAGNHEVPDPSPNGSAQPDAGAVPPQLVPTLFVLEAPTYYHALALFLAPGGTPKGWGYARESRYQHVRRRRDGQGEAEEIQVERSDALPACVSEAWAHACARLSAAPGLDGIAQLLTTLQSRHDIGELIAALFGVAGQSDDAEPDRTDGVHAATNGQVPLATRP